MKFKVEDVIKYTEYNADETWRVIYVDQYNQKYRIVCMYDKQNQYSLGNELTLPFNYIDTHFFKREDKQEEQFERWWEGVSEPACTCCSKVLFDEGCQCSYADWKRNQA